MNNITLAIILRETMEAARREDHSGPDAVGTIIARCADTLTKGRPLYPRDYKEMFLALCEDQD